MKVGCTVLAFAGALGLISSPARGGLFWHGGVRTNPITVCFVGDALSVQPRRVSQIRQYLMEFGEVANIDFEILGACPPAIRSPDGYDWYGGDVRVAIPETRVDATLPVPGNGCDNDRLGSAPDAVSPSPGRIDVFWRGWDGSLRHRWWQGDRWRGSENLGGSLTSGAAVASPGPDRLEVFARGADNAIWQRSWEGRLGWTTWRSIGGFATSSPAAGSRREGHLDVFVRGTDGAVWQDSWSGSGWSGWRSLGGIVTSAPAVASPGPDRLEVFARGTDNAIWQRSWDGSRWSDWRSIGGLATSAPAAVSREPGRVDVFARGRGNALFVSSWNGSSWSPWRSLGGSLSSAPAAAPRLPAPNPGQRVDRFDVFYQGRTESLWARVWEKEKETEVWEHKDIGENAGWGSWSHAPIDLELRRSCLYNLKLGNEGDDGVPYLNHTLHEFGHALGLAHEHQRVDVDRVLCDKDGFGGGAVDGFLTPYDRDSVMHYQFLDCGIHGNYGYSGFSKFDRLALHILYPEDHRVAEFLGRTVIVPPDRLELKSAWMAAGARIGYVAPSWSWKVDGILRSTRPVLEVTLPEGTHTLSLEHDDFLGRRYSYQGLVRVLSPRDFTREVASLPAALASLH